VDGEEVLGAGVGGALCGAGVLGLAGMPGLAAVLGGGAMVAGAVLGGGAMVAGAVLGGGVYAGALGVVRPVDGDAADDVYDGDEAGLEAGAGVCTDPRCAD
jgi:hypothetical protein